MEYFEQEEKHLFNIVTEEAERNFMKPINLSFRNDGPVTSGKCNIEILISDSNHVYTHSALHEETGTKPEPPIRMPQGVFPMITLTQKHYKIREMGFSKLCE